MSSSPASSVGEPSRVDSCSVSSVSSGVVSWDRSGAANSDANKSGVVTDTSGMIKSPYIHKKLLPRPARHLLRSDLPLQKHERPKNQRDSRSRLQLAHKILAFNSPRTIRPY